MYVSAADIPDDSTRSYRVFRYQNSLWRKAEGSWQEGTFQRSPGSPVTAVGWLLLERWAITTVGSEGTTSSVWWQPYLLNGKAVLCCSPSSRQVLSLVLEAQKVLRYHAQAGDRGTWTNKQISSAKVQDRGLATKSCWIMTAASYSREFCMWVF